MEWQEKFNDAFAECAMVSNKIFPITEKFVELEKKYGLFHEYLKASRMLKSSDIVGTIQIIVGIPILCGMGGGALLWFLSDESTALLATGAIIGGIIGVLLAILILKKVPMTSGEKVEKKVAMRTGKKTSENRNATIIREQRRLIDEQDSIIEGEWRNAFNKLEQLINSAPSDSFVIENDDAFSKVQELNHFFSAITREARRKDERSDAWKKDLVVAGKVAAGVAIVAGIAAIAIGNAAKNSDFGEY